MTITEKIEMYKGKRDFIKNISKAFEAKPSKTSVTSVDYEVYRRKVTINNEERDHFVEYIVVHFFGGGLSAKFVSGNSNSANFRAIGELIDGGYYDEVREYETLEDRGFSLVTFEEKETLDALLRQPMNHISDIHKCFEHCKDSADVKRVISMIPSGFGSFEAIFDDEESFSIINEYTDELDIVINQTDFDFWEEN